MRPSPEQGEKKFAKLTSGEKKKKKKKGILKKIKQKR